jgi:hypothetical protein
MGTIRRFGPGRDEYGVEFDDHPHMIDMVNASWIDRLSTPAAE